MTALPLTRVAADRVGGLVGTGGNRTCLIHWMWLFSGVPAVPALETVLARSLLQNLLQRSGWIFCLIQIPLPFS